MFTHTFAIARVPADFGGIHTVAISRSGRVYTRGHNNTYQLCIRDAYNNTAFVDYFHEVRPWRRCFCVPSDAS